jgi:iduronate 2-sulfatase
MKLHTILLSLLTTALTVSAKPNVLFIAVDDMRNDLGCYEHPVVISPNIDKLAAAGTLFNRAYCQQAVCNPSRASALTGLRLETLDLWDLPTHFRQRRPDVVTLPQLFKNNGYHTQCIGKIFHNWRQDDYKGDPRSWSVPSEMHYNAHGRDKPGIRGVMPPDTAKTPRCEARDVPDEAYFDGRIAALAKSALHGVNDKPFFLAVGFWKPHLPFNAPQKYWDLYDRDKIDMPVNTAPPENVPEIALHNGREVRGGFGGRVPNTQQTRTLRHGYYAAISYVDAQIGKVIDELDRLGLRDNTIVILWSDHGFHLGENSLWAKTSNFELDARVPLIIDAPGFDGGQRADALVELLDMYPTLADLCGLKPPADLAGKSLRPILLNPAETVKNAAFTWHPRPAYPKAGSDPDAMGHSMRTARYRYTEWRNYKDGAVIARELYDHQIDPRETKNVAAATEHAELVKTLAEQLKK